MHRFQFLCHSFPLVIIHDLHCEGVPFAPRKTNTPLVIDADAVLALPITFKPLQSVSRQCRERCESRRGVEHVQFPKGLALNGLEPANGFSMEEALGISASEGPDHIHKSILLYSKCKAVWLAYFRLAFLRMRAYLRAMRP